MFEVPTFQQAGGKIPEVKIDNSKFLHFFQRSDSLVRADGAVKFEMINSEYSESWYWTRIFTNIVDRTPVIYISEARIVNERAAFMMSL